MLGSAACYSLERFRLVARGDSMPTQTRIVFPGPREATVLTAEGEVLGIPADWCCLLPGDAGLTRRFKAAGPTWTVIEWIRKKKYSRGVWGSARLLEKLKSELETERGSESYAKKRVADRARRETKQAAYVAEFREAVLEFLDFHPAHAKIAQQLADAVSLHATPVGSGTVARTGQIPIEQRAEAAVIAWLRHQTTAYDYMDVGRAKGLRREIRQQLAQASRQLLWRYRMEETIDASTCPLQQGLDPNYIPNFDELQEGY
jgi:hypothetical protein